MLNIGTGECRACHTEHKGREADITQLSRAQFDHHLTNFELKGAHSTLDCTSCHKPNVAYWKAPEACVGCHKSDDVHHGQYKQFCGECHSSSSWNGGKFDHSKTEFNLTGAHTSITCDACHIGGHYKPTPNSCNGCHQADDSHSARLGPKCNDCHGNDKWKPVNYDHLAKTKYALIGNHIKLDCHVCHTASVKTQKLAKDCVGCHRSEDPHGGKIKGGCDTCHGQKTWTSDITFDHDLTHYPLLGLHRVVSCAQCHKTLAFAGTPTKCIECHSHDDVHKGGLGKKCESCHSSNGWPIWVFDHAKEAHFPLLGAHAKLKCADCHHETPGFVKMSQQCGACHHQDDRHLGLFGAQCDRCHRSYSWKGARIP